MTKQEYNKCEKLMNYAINKGNEAEELWKQSEQLQKENNTIQAEIKQRQADQFYGEVIGINQALTTLNFKHDKMKVLSDLL